MSQESYRNHEEVISGIFPRARENDFNLKTPQCIGFSNSGIFQWKLGLGPALPSEGRGHRFESCRVRQ